MATSLPTHSLESPSTGGAETALRGGLQDGFGRRFHYLRLSVTDACNFRCFYCLPNGYARPEGQAEPLSEAELLRLVRGFAPLGIQKVRLTGGEPTLRRDLLSVAQGIHQIPGIERLALSTNGYRLKPLARGLLDAGIRGLNVSVNSLSRTTYRQITGQDKLPAVLEGIEEALALGFPSVKVNVVLLKGINDHEVGDFFTWARNTPLHIRFIELMPTELNQGAQAHRLASDSVLNRLLEEGWLRQERRVDDGPAVEFRHPTARGSVGYIAPYDRSFCSNCNRLRVTSQGLLRLCLFGASGVSLRPLLQSDEQQMALKMRIQQLLSGKSISHRLNEGVVGETASFSVMGG